MSIRKVGYRFTWVLSVLVALGIAIGQAVLTNLYGLMGPSPWRARSPLGLVLWPFMGFLAVWILYRVVQWIAAGFKDKSK